jgi:hypothetical protein
MTSGGRWDRPELHRLLDQLREGDTVVVWKLDRLFVHVPLVPWPWSAAAQAVGETRAEFLAPASHRLIGDDDATLSQYQLNIP